MQLQEFRDELLELFLQFLWRQWSSLGVAGYGDSGDNWVIDPEALLLFSASIARYDQRLFDEILDWLDQNERFLNVQRLRTILEREGFVSSQIISAIAGRINRNKSGLKWKKLASSYQIGNGNVPKNLFFLKSGSSMPVVGDKDLNYLDYGLIRNPVKNRGLSKTFPTKKIPSLLLQIRALFGINSRCETLLYLLINENGTIQEIADQNYYAWRSIQDVLYEMGHSSVISFPGVKRGRVYYLDAEPWRNILLNDRSKSIQWVCWPPLFRALEIIWDKLNEPLFIESTSLEQSAEIGKLMVDELLPRFSKAGMGTGFNRLIGSWGEEYLEYWLESIKGILG